MKTIIKEINLFDIEDIEEMLSNYFNKKINISQVNCTLAYYMPFDTQEPDGMYIEFMVGGETVDTFDLFEDIDYTWKGKKVCLKEPYLPIEEIFNFDVSLFKSFEFYIDSSN